MAIPDRKSLCIALWNRAGHVAPPKDRKVILFPGAHFERVLGVPLYDGSPDGHCKCGYREGHAAGCEYAPKPASSPQPASRDARPDIGDYNGAYANRFASAAQESAEQPAKPESDCPRPECEQRAGITPREAAKVEAPFKVGDRVRCVNDSGATDPECVKKGCEYTIANVNGSFVSTAELPGPFCAWRFVLAAQEHVERGAAACPKTKAVDRPGWYRSGSDSWPIWDHSVLGCRVYWLDEAHGWTVFGDYHMGHDLDKAMDRAEQRAIAKRSAP